MPEDIAEQRRKLKKLIEELEQRRGRHTELVTVYVPAGSSITDMMGQLRNEQGTAENIKSKATRKNVVNALDKIIQHLKLYKRTPANGLAAFCGNVSEKEGVDDLQLWTLEPPDQLFTKLYWCDQRFDLDPLRDMVKEKEIYGLFVIDSTDADAGMLRGKRVSVLSHMDSPVPSKIAAGGQSAARFERVRQGLIEDHMKRAASMFREQFEAEDVRGVIVGGPGPMKEKFVEGDYLSDSLKKKIIGVKDIGYTGDHGLDELFNRSQDILKEAAVAKEKEIVKGFFDELHRGGKAVYGLNEVRKAIEMGAAATVLVSEKAELEEVEFLCDCGFSEKTIVKKSEKSSHTCKQCSKNMKVVGEREMVEALEELAATTGAKVVHISRDTAEGEQLYQVGGIGALLRYKI
ncbi:MAG: peptide chain release factor aRF-1 [Candidatus Aenigmarchaeota archaeon]|nr:peptide chain release factor aRF-1 [Candidatus Aenigmarchaeota archaeon]